MSQEDIAETIILYTRLRDDLKPLSIWTVDLLEPINPDWVGISHSILNELHRVEANEGYNIAFYRDDGKLLEHLQFDTLEIAKDQAKTIVGIEHREWRECKVSVSDDGRVAWASVSEPADESKRV